MNIYQIVLLITQMIPKVLNFFYSSFHNDVLISNNVIVPIIYHVTIYKHDPKNKRKLSRRL